MAQAVTTTNPGRVLASAAVLPTLTHLAVGTGVWAGGAAPDAGQIAERQAATALKVEIGRVPFLQRGFVVVDAGGPIDLPGGPYRLVTGPTDLGYFRFRLEDDQAVATLTELGLFGGDVAFIRRGAVLRDAVQNGDDRANQDVLVGGTFALADSQRLTVSCSTGGGSGTARIDWTSNGSAPGGANLLVTFNAPVLLGATGIALTFTGGADAALTLADQWTIDLTTEPQAPRFAAGGVFDGVLNRTGQVLRAGTLARLYVLAPGEPHTAVTDDLQFVVPLIRSAA